MKFFRVVLPSLIVITALFLGGCKSKKSVESSAEATEAFVPAETMTGSTAPKEQSGADRESAARESQEKETSKNASQVDNVKAEIQTYSSNQISIEYPVVSNMNSSEKEDLTNSLLRENALSLLNFYEADETQDSLWVKCQVVSVDRQRLTAVYTGEYTAKEAAYPTAVFYTNTIDLNRADSLGLGDYADAYTVAGYIMSGDCTFYNVSGEQERQLLDYKNTQTFDSYYHLLQNADFPAKNSAFPESFSYEKQGVIYFSIPVPHTLGDYALITFTPATK